MTDATIQKKIAVIFITDVVGFSALMAKNKMLRCRAKRHARIFELDYLMSTKGGILIPLETQS